MKSLIIFKILTFVNKLFVKNKRKISLWGRQMVNDNTLSMLDFLIGSEDFKDYKIICHFEDKKRYESYKNMNVKIVGNILISVFHLFSSSIILHAQGMSMAKFKTSGKQVIFDMQHGMGHIEKDASWMRGVLSSYDDYMLCTSEKLLPLINYQYGITPEKAFICGNPRNDLFFSQNSAREKLNLERYKKTILFMPTYRTSKINGNDCSIDFPLLNTENITEFGEFLKEKNVLLIIKPHPLQNNIDIFNKKYENIITMTNEDLAEKGILLYQLVKEADALLTDISSIATDYMLLNKPIGYVLSDIQEYKMGRGYIVVETDGTISENPDSFEVPGSSIYELEDLKEFVADIVLGKDDYADIRAAYNQFNNCENDGNNCKKIMDFLVKKING